MNPNYWKIAKWSLFALLGILVLAILLKVRMFFILAEFLGVFVAVLIAGLVAYDFFKMHRKGKEPLIETRGSYTPTAPMVPPPRPPAKKSRKKKSFNPPSI